MRINDYNEMTLEMMTSCSLICLLKNQNGGKLQKNLYFYKNHREIEKSDCLLVKAVDLLNKKGNLTQKRRYTRKTQLTSVKENIIPFSRYPLSSKNRR
jgi:hypothetical protein